MISKKMSIIVQDDLEKMQNDIWPKKRNSANVTFAENCKLLFDDTWWLNN